LLCLNLIPLPLTPSRVARRLSTVTVTLIMSRTCGPGKPPSTSLSYTDAGGVVNQMEYHYLGAILTKKKLYRNGAVAGETRYVYDGSQVVQERDANKNLVNEYTYGLGLEGGIGGLLDLQQGGASGPQYSYLFDGKGNVTGLLDGVGQVAQTYQYDPFGVPKGASGSVSQPMQFSTKPYDDQTGLSYYYGYRFYVPSLGRWLTRDPIGEEGGINLYGFVNNDPMNWIDPDGEFPLWVICTGAGMAGVYIWLEIIYPILHPSVKKIEPHPEPKDCRLPIPEKKRGRCPLSPSFPVRPSK